MEIIINKSGNTTQQFTADYFSSDFKLNESILENCNFRKEKLKLLSYRITDGSHITPNYQKEGIKFLMVTNITDEGLDFKNTKFITKLLDRKLSHCKPFPKDILFSKIGVLYGKARIVPANAPRFNIFVSLAVIKNVFPDISAKFLEIYLNTNLTYKQISRDIKGIGVPDLHLENIGEITVIVPKQMLQRSVIDFNKSEKTRINILRLQLQELSERFNHFLFSKLKVTVPKTVQNNIFNKTSAFLGNRFDALYLSESFVDIKTLLQNSKCNFQIKSLKEICYSITSGQRPKGGVGNILEGIPSLGGEHIDQDGTLKEDQYKMKYIPKAFHRKYKSCQVKLNDILICKDGATTGKVAIVTQNFLDNYCIANINEHIYRITVLEGYNACYVFSILFSEIGQQQLLRCVSGGAQGGITSDTFSEIIIPVLDKNIQKEIEAKFRSISEKKKQVLENIKKFDNRRNSIIEKMIIGEEVS